MEPLIAACFDDDADERDVAEILEILTHVVSSVMTRYANGEMRAEEFLPVLEMTVRRLTAGTTP